MNPVRFLVLPVIALTSLLPAVLQAQSDLGVAQYDAQEGLKFPANTDEWIHMGSSLGSEYSDEPFDAADPGTIGVVKLEPEAYRYFKEHGEYADGTMFLLSFYTSEAESRPQLPGFVQGELEAKEIHVVDSQRFSEGRGFFLYPGDAAPGSATRKVPDGSACFVCHMAEGDYNGTFTQFYPSLRHLLGE